MSGRAVLVRAAALTLVAGLLSGCGLVSLQGVPLPGGAELGSRPIQLTAEFRDVLDLVPQASVKVNNVTVGEVQGITLNYERWTANVMMAINGDVRLPANALAEIRQTTLLGEKYVLLAEPTEVPPRGDLTDGATIPLERTTNDPEVEQVLGALSMLLNGGGVAQLQSISRELNKALVGNETEIKALLDDLDTFVGTLDSQRGNIVQALDGLDRLSANLAAQRENLDIILRDLEPGLAVLNDQRDELVGLLEALDELSVVAVDVINRSQEDFVADLEALEPTLRELAIAGDDVATSLEALVTVPFVDAVQDVVRGDYANIDVRLDLRLETLLQNFLPSIPQPLQVPDPLNPLTPAPPPLPVPAPAPLDEVPDDPLDEPLDELPLPGLGGGP